MQTLTKEQLVTECANKVLTAVVSGNLKESIAEIVENVLQWNSNQTLTQQPVLLNEAEKVVTPAVDPVDPRAPRPAAVGPQNVSSDESRGVRPASVGNKATEGWGNLFQGTSWGAK